MFREAFLEQQRLAVADALKHDKHVLIVGARDTNLSPGLLKSDFLTLWQADNNTVINREIPKNIGIVLFTRFVGHGTVNVLYKQALAKGVFCVQQVLQTGELKSVLEPLLNFAPSNFSHKAAPAQNVAPQPMNGTATMSASATKPEPVSAPLPQKSRPGEILEFVREFANLTTDNNAVEARALLPKAKALGITTTEGSLANTIGRVKREKPIPGQRPGALVYNAPPQTPPAKPGAPLTDNIDESIRLITESIAALSLVREELVKTKEIIKNNSQAFVTLKQLKGLLSGI